LLEGREKEQRDGRREEERGERREERGERREERGERREERGERREKREERREERGEEVPDMNSGGSGQGLCYGLDYRQREVTARHGAQYDSYFLER
jgi:hypothetical protein